MRKCKRLTVIIMGLLLLLAGTVIACSEPAPAPEPSPAPAPAPAPEPAPAPPPEPEKKPVEVELKYDDGTSRDCLSSSGGFLVDFTAPAAPFTITQVRILGGVFGEPTKDNFEVAIWNQDREVLYEEEFPVTMFADSKPSLAEIDVPDVEVDGTFYVHVFTGTERLKGVHICADDSVPNEHSTITTRGLEGDKETDEWRYGSDIWFSDKSKVNWMIRVVGTYLE